MFLLVLATYTFLGVYEFVPLYKQKLWKDFFVNMGIGIVSLCIALLLSFEIVVPSPTYPIRDFIRSIIGK